MFDEELRDEFLKIATPQIDTWNRQYSDFFETWKNEKKGKSC